MHVSEEDLEILERILIIGHQSGRNPNLGSGVRTESADFEFRLLNFQYGSVGFVVVHLLLTDVGCDSIFVNFQISQMLTQIFRSIRGDGAFPRVALTI